MTLTLSRMVSDSIYNRNLPKIILLCFFAPSFFYFLWAGEVLLVGWSMDYTPKRLTYHSISCGMPLNVIPVNYIASVCFYFTIAITAFFFSRTGFKKGNVDLMLIGAFLFYPIANRQLLTIPYLLSYNPFSFIKDKINLTNQFIPLFGNRFNFALVDLISGHLLIIFYFYLAWQIVIMHWNKPLRIQFFTFGLVSCLLGKLFWFKLLGPFLMPDNVH